MADQGQMFSQQEQPDNGSEGQQAQESSMFKVGDREYTAEDAAKKIQNADEFIEQLKREREEDKRYRQEMEEKFAEMARKLDTASKLDDVVSSSREAPQEQPKPAEQTTQPAVDEDALMKRFEQYMQEQSQTRTRAENMKAAVDAASKRYGSEWQSKLLEQGKALGMDETAIQNMAETSPQAFARLFDIGSSSSTEADAVSGGHVGQQAKPPEEPKSVMFGATTKDLVDQWRYSGKRVGETNQFDYDPKVHSIAKQR